MIHDKSNSSNKESKCSLVFDAGMGNWSVFFKPLAKLLEPHIPVLLIDRAGYAYSQLPETKRLSNNMALEMNAMLEAKGITENIILAGHSLGGLNARMFYKLFPEKVSGMILLDAAHPFLLEKIPVVKKNIEVQIKQVSKIIFLAKLGLLRFGKKKIPTFGLPDSLLDEYFSVTLKSRYYRIYKMELEAFEENLRLCKSLPSLGALPLLVVGSPDGLNRPINDENKVKRLSDKRWLELQMELVRLSTQSAFVLSKGGHFLHLTDTRLVADSIIKFYSSLVNTSFNAM